jgi:hypothetical protein
MAQAMMASRVVFGGRPDARDGRLASVIAVILRVMSLSVPHI